MKKLEQVIKSVFLVGVFICYVILLIKILFLSRVSITELFDSQRPFVRSVNLVPFKSISEFLAGSTVNLHQFAFANVGGNILIFIPLGVYLSLFANNTQVRIKLLHIVMASSFVEVIQGLFGIGSADIDDIILNGLGGWIGILGYAFLRFALRSEKNVHTAITVLSAIVGLPVAIYLLFMIKMRF